MPARAVADGGGFELVQQLALLRSQVDRCLDHRLAVQVAGAAAAHGLDALVAQAEHLAGLGFGGDADLGLTVERWHAHGVAERGLRNADRDFAVQVRSEEHTSELQSLMRTSYAVFCLQKKNNTKS